VSWSPDGNRLAVSTTRISGSSEQIVGVVLMAADGSSRRVVAADGSGLRYLHEGGLVSWSPNSHYLVVSDAVVSLDGCDHHLLTPQKNQNFAVWSPDSRSIAVVAFTGW
jgi:hypothetical protein